MSEPPIATPLLGYARDDRRHLRRWAGRIILIAWAAATLWLAYDVWGRPGRLHLELMRAQSRCAQYGEPPGTVVLEPDRGRGALLATRAGYRAAKGDDPFVFSLSPSAPEPQGTPAILDLGARVWAAYAESIERSSQLRLQRTRVDPDADDDADERAFPLLEGGWKRAPPTDNVTVLVHRFVASDGSQRLIKIDADWFGDDGAVSFNAAGWLPATWRDRPHWVDVKIRGQNSPDGRRADYLQPATSDRIRLFAGQPDPGDPSRFTIRYELGSHGGGTIEGLLITGDMISLAVLDGPFAPRESATSGRAGRAQ